MRLGKWFAKAKRDLGASEIGLRLTRRDGTVLRIPRKLRIFVLMSLMGQRKRHMSKGFRERMKKKLEDMNGKGVTR